jgi:hypothetical protein
MEERGPVHVLEHDLGDTGADWLERAIAAMWVGINARLEAEARMDEIDADRTGREP